MSEPYRDPPPSEDEGGDVVAVGTYTTAVEAEMAREYLKSHAIPATVADPMSFNPMLNMAMASVRLLVRSTDEGRARSLLRQVAKADADEDDGFEDEVRCPRCELTYCFHQHGFSSPGVRSLAWSPLLLMLAVPLGLAGKRWHCHKCLHVWDDPKEGPKRMTPLADEDPRPVFRLRRHRAGTGFVLGFLAMVLAMMSASALSAPAPLVLVPLVLPILGYVLGKRAITDVCSAPNCRAVLPRGAAECRSCHGSVAGVIRAAHEHYAEAADVRRELFALRNEEARTEAAPEKKRPRKKRRPALGTATPAS